MSLVQDHDIKMYCSGSPAIPVRHLIEKLEFFQDKLQSLQNQLRPIRLVSAASNQRHFFLTTEDRNFGYDLYRDQFEMIVKNNQPSDSQIYRCAVSHPQQRLFNLRLSIFNVLKYTEKSGCFDTMLKNVLITFLTKHQPELIDMIDPHSLSTREFIENVSYDINTTGEKNKAMMALTNFQRSDGQLFSASITNFETLFSFSFN